MIRRRELTRLYEARRNEAMQHGTDLAGAQRGCVQFLREFHETFGVRLAEGPEDSGFLTDERGLGYKARGSANSNELTFRTLAEAVAGHQFVEEYYNPANQNIFGSRRLMEAALDFTAFLNISTINLGIAGLLNARIMERFDAPEYLGRNLVTIVPTKANGHKIIAAAKLAAQQKTTKYRQAGEQHTAVGFGEMYQSTPETLEQALKVEVPREAVFFEVVGGQVMETAGTVIGDELAYGMEKDIADAMLGVQGLPSRYNFNGTSYETYQSASPYVNDQSNPFADITSIDKARQLFVGMTDPATGREIAVNSYTILCMPFQELRMRQQLFGPNVQIGTQPSAGNFPTFYTSGTPNALNQVGRGTYTLMPLTAIWRNRALAADGLALSGPAADLYYWVGDYQKAFEWHENWPLQSWTASADELLLKDRGLIMVHGANYRGTMFVREPRYVVRNRN